MKNLRFLFIFSLFPFVAKAQETIMEPPVVLNLSGFLDVYYGYDFNQPANHERAGFLYNHKRHNEFNVNLGMIKLNLDGGGRYRANVALMAGNYAQYNLAAEPTLLQSVYEANAGVSLNKANNLWVDAGIFSSHIGFESAITSDNWTLTRSLLAENSPYYLAGAKVTWQPSTAWTLTGLVLNGWQRIRRVDGNSLPAFGTQVTYAAGNTTLNWSTFIGSDDPDTLRRMRVFNNFYGKFQVTEKFGILAGFDIGFQETQREGGDMKAWYSPVLILRQQLNDRWAVAVRGEYYSDENLFIISPPDGQPFKASGVSLNLDFAPYQNVMFRMEGRWMGSENKAFEKDGGLTDSDVFVVGSLAVKIP